MENVLEVVRVLAGLSVEQLTLFLAFAALGVAALAIHAIAGVRKDKDQ